MKISAIALTTIKSVIRSKLFIILLFLIPIVGMFIHFATNISPSQTVQAKLTIKYIMIISQLLIILSTLWSSTATISQDIEDRYIHLIVTKPVTASQIWLGKWLGILIMNASLTFLLLLVVYASIYIKASRINKLKEMDSFASEILSTHSVFGADREKNISKETESYAILPGSQVSWTIKIPPHLSKDLNTRNITLNFRFTASFRDRKPISGTISIGTEKNDKLFCITLKNASEGLRKIIIPVNLIPDGTDEIKITFGNDPQPLSNTAILDFKRSVELLVSNGTLGTNLLRTGIILFAQQAIAAALGITAGIVFSFPVATFFSFGIIIVCLLSQVLTGPPELVESHHGAQQHSALVKTIVKSGEYIAQGIVWATSPIFENMPINKASEGENLGTKKAIYISVLITLVYPFFIYLIGTMILRKKEIALPETI